MRALILLVLVAFATHAYGKERRPPVRPVVAAIAPAAARWQAAPVPDRDIRDSFGEARIPVVTLFSTANHGLAPDQGLGYAPGSRYQIDNGRRWLYLPGIMVNLPLP